MIEIILWSLAALFALLGITLVLLWVISRTRPEWLALPLNWMRRFDWARKRIDRASAQALAKDTDTLMEELPTAARKQLEKSFQGRSEKERATLLEELQSMAEQGRSEDAARLLQQKKKDPRKKSKEVQRRRKQRKAAKRKKKK